MSTSAMASNASVVSNQNGKYQMLTKLGEGTYGVVYKGKNLQTGKTVALKKIKLVDNMNEGMPSTALREVSVLKSLRHRNIVNLLDIVSSSSKLLLVFEFCSYDLKQLVNQTKQPIRGAKFKSFSHQLLTGLSFCHSNRIIHRDLKPQNILIIDGVLKLADFGLARAFQVPLPAYTHEVVTLWYRAPEILLGEKKYTTVVDTWSVGTIMVEMLNAKPLFPGDCEIDELFQIFRLFGTPTDKTWPAVDLLPDYQPVFPRWAGKGLASVVPGDVDPEALDLMEKLLTYNPATRITAVSACKHPWFNDVVAVSTAMP